MTDAILKAWRQENADQRQRVKRAGESEVVEDRIDTLLDEAERLRAALKPFADFAVGWNPNWSDSTRLDETDMDVCPTLGDCRRAKEVLE